VDGKFVPDYLSCGIPVVMSRHQNERDFPDLNICYYVTACLLLAKAGPGPGLFGSLSAKGKAYKKLLEVVLHASEKYDVCSRDYRYFGRLNEEIEVRYKLTKCSGYMLFEVFSELNAEDSNVMEYYKKECAKARARQMAYANRSKNSGGGGGGGGEKLKRLQDSLNKEKNLWLER
jgi:hypothetical protein